MRFDLSRLGAWRDLPFFDEALPEIEVALASAFLPPQEKVFAALERTQPAAVRVVILGQDPYPTPGHAHGFAFSAEPETKPLPRSLGNIFKELDSDIGARPPNADLRFWADQGVLLLNTALTVPAGMPQGTGWRRRCWSDCQISHGPICCGDVTRTVSQATSTRHATSR